MVALLKAANMANGQETKKKRRRRDVCERCQERKVSHRLFEEGGRGSSLTEV